MHARGPIRIAVVSDFAEPDWVWIADLMRDATVGGRPLAFRPFTMHADRTPAPAAARPVLRRFRGLARAMGGAALARSLAGSPVDLVTSHGPYVSEAVARALARLADRPAHIAFAFNFTTLPTGPRRALMRGALAQVDEFAVFTDAERDLYAAAFDLPPDRFIRAPWGVRPPLTAIPPRECAEPYFAALGGEARDYRTLCLAAERTPDIRYVVVARPKNMHGLMAPPNVRIETNLPFERAWGVVANAVAAILPLESGETPCGIVTLVGAMHLGKAQVATRAAGVAEYLEDGETALLAPPNDPEALAGAVRRLAADPALAHRLGETARARAAQRHTEAATCAFFRERLARRFG